MLGGPSAEVEFEMPLEGLGHQLLDVLRRHRLHALILLLDLLFNFATVGLHLDLGGLKLLHDLHLHGDCFVRATLAPEVEGRLEFAPAESC